MAFDRELWSREYFFRDWVPDWPCPKCRRTGSLRVQDETLHSEQSAASRDAEADFHRAQAYENGGEFATKGRFSTLIKCNHPDCGEVVAASGRFKEQEVQDDQERTYFLKHFYPESLSPAPPMFLVPEDCPPAVRGEVNSAFAIFWSDRSGSLNRLRSSLEALLESLGIPGIDANGNFINLHTRIQNILAPHHARREALTAAKRLGNAGSHAGEIGILTVLDAMQLLDQVLHDFFDDPAGAVATIIREVNSRRGPRR